jgi:NAD(P)H-hydrate epimerase
VTPVVTAAEIKELDRATIEEVGIPALTLMETAGRACADAVEVMLGHGHGQGHGHGAIAVVCGPGNNGGDGFVIARVLRARGYDAVAYLAVPRAAVKGDAAAHLAILERAGGVVRSIAAANELADLEPAIARAAVAVDALFGVGLARPIEGHLARVVAAIDRAPRRLAVDIPSGLDTNTGQTLGVCVHAQRTVTMAALKIALAGAPGFAACGEVTVAEIGIPAEMIAAAAGASLVVPADLATWLRRPTPLDHENTRGHVLVVGGSPGLRGAGRMAALAALRAGAGLATLAAAEADAAAPDPVMTRALGTGKLEPLLAGKAAVVIGPGLDPGELAWVREVLAAGIPAVLDAGALAVGAEAIAAAAGPVVITPHPGEAARLLGMTVAALEIDRLATARMLATATRAVVCYKGARTVVVDGTLADPHASIIGAGSPALATGGSGDVLAGTIGALLAQGLVAVDAVRAGALVHGLAGEISGSGTIASDLPPAIARVIADAISPMAPPAR